MIKNALRRAGASKKVWLAALAVAGLSTATAGVALADVSTPDATPGVSANATAFSLKSFGAKADGKSNDAPALDKAISAASTAGGGVVNVPAGVTVLAAGTVHLKSNVTINVPAGSTITGSASIPSEWRMPSSRAVFALQSPNRRDQVVSALAGT